jgi:hypothetical protein
MSHVSYTSIYEPCLFAEGMVGGSEEGVARRVRWGELGAAMVSEP